MPPNQAFDVAGMPIKTIFFSEDKLMNKLIAVLIAGIFALGSVAAMAQIPAGEKTPPQPVDQAKLKAEKDAAKAAAAAMTPEEKAAARKAKRAKKQQEAGAITKQADTGDKMAQQQKEKADAAAAKGQPKALPDAKAKQDALKEQTKKASGQ